MYQELREYWGSHKGMHLYLELAGLEGKAYHALQLLSADTKYFKYKLRKATTTRCGYKT